MKKKTLFIITMLMVSLALFSQLSERGQTRFYNGTQWQPPMLNPETNVVETIDFFESKTLSSQAFTASYSNDCTNTNEMTCIGFSLPDTTQKVYLEINGYATDDAILYLYENTSADTSEGTDLTIYNLNRNSIETSILLNLDGTPESNKLSSYDEAAADSANITTTTPIFFELITDNKLLSNSPKVILKADTEYVVMIKSLNDNDNKHCILLHWVEYAEK
jgi:hypothetical protein